MKQRVQAHLIDAVRRRRPLLEQVSLDLHSTPETRFEEHFAVEQITHHLSAAGFDVDKDVGGLATAFTATHRGPTDGPTIAILLEYDALPGLGHGCGHNLIAAGGLTAALAAAATTPDHPGTLTVIGTPGEEGGGGKIILLEHGVFDTVDAAVMFHGADRSLRARHALACSQMRFTFHGTAAHAAKGPWEGRSAAAGAQLFMSAVDTLRQFVPPTARIHGIVTHGGDAANVVPERAEVEMFVREATSDALDELVPRVLAAAEGAALASGTRVENVETAPRYAERRNNMVMADRMAAYTSALGLDLEPPSTTNAAGSSDIGNVSAHIPVIHPYVQICPRGTPSHSVAMREAARSPEAHDTVVITATALAALVLDLLSDPALLVAARQEFISPSEAESSDDVCTN